MEKIWDLKDWDDTRGCSNKRSAPTDIVRRKAFDGRRLPSLDGRCYTHPSPICFQHPSNTWLEMGLRTDGYCSTGGPAPPACEGQKLWSCTSAYTCTRVGPKLNLGRQEYFGLVG